MPSVLFDIFARLATRDVRRTEAEIQADIRQFILTAPFQLEDHDLSVVQLEAQLGDGRRIDVEVGATVIEVKRDLRSERVRTEAEVQLSGYVENRTAQTNLRYVGILTDGTDWYCYQLVDHGLKLVAQITLTPNQDDVERLVVWLEGVLATTKDILPTAAVIEARLGATSSAYILDRATVAEIYQRNKDNTSVAMKRTLWARLLTSALGTQFDDSDDLFIEHTLLVNSAEIIAHAVLGLEPENLNPVALLAGEKFDEAGIYGVVEQDFFDWIVEVEKGPAFIRTLSKRLARFDWDAVEQDVLKILYESIIGTETRKRLGEYYTPDWLASVVVETTITEPLSTRALDAACGSGTFLFHAVRLYFEAAERAGIAIREQIEGVTAHVFGMDLHPVAVTLARVTYLLAIGRQRLTNPLRGTIQIPVYLGDSLQWQEQSTDLMAAGNLTIKADDKQELFDSELLFPDELLEDAGRFDNLVNELANRAANRRAGSVVPSLNGVFQRLAIAEQYRSTVEATFRTMCRLHDENRDHIWGYYVRNLARPLWLSRPGNRVDVLIGNPPWLAYRNMTGQMQATFKTMSKKRGLWAEASMVTHQDLAGLFAVRACELYLRDGGRFGLVLPNTAIDRDHYRGFRRGRYGDATIGMSVAFGEAWDLRRIRPHFFPRAASVVFGARAPDAIEMPEAAQIWSGKLTRSNQSWEHAAQELTRVPGILKRTGALVRSPYDPAFTQGAIFAPRVAFVVEEQTASSIGRPAGRISVRSSRSVQEKAPWRSAEALTGVVESEYVRPYYSGDNILPYRLDGHGLIVVPAGARGLMDRTQIDAHAGLSGWWEKADNLWVSLRKSVSLSLSEQLNYQSKLSKQIPIPELRVVYNRAGMHVVAAKVVNRRALVGNGLYWAAVRTTDEANYLCAILNAPITTELARPFMSYGKDERDIHKHVWELPVPLYDESNPVHVGLSALAATAEVQAAAFEVNPQVHFAATRRHIRESIAESKIGLEINEVVYELIS